METLPYKQILSGIAIALTFAAFFPYIRNIISGDARPHVFSWVIWGATTFVVFIAQLTDKGGVGAWPIGVSGILTISIAILAYIKRADITIKPSDWLFFLSALSSLPLWYVMSDPLWAVVVLTLVDILGFAPTVRKTFYSPYSESLVFFSLFTVRNMLVILALEHYSVTTVLFPAAIALACIALIGMMICRRRAIST